GEITERCHSCPDGGHWVVGPRRQHGLEVEQLATPVMTSAGAMRPAIAVLHARPGPAALHDQAVTGGPLLHYTTLRLGRPGFNHPPRAIHTSVIASPALHRGALDCATPGAQPGACSLVLTDTWARRSSHEIAKRAPPTRTACQTVFAFFPHRDHWGVR